MRKIFIVAGAVIASSGALAADYRSQYYEPRAFPSADAAPVYAPHVPPVYYLPSPPQYVQDLRTGAPGRWVQLQPSFFDRLFGTGDGY